MTTIKKGYTEVFAILNANMNKKVKDILDELMPIFESQTRDSNHRYTEDGVLEIFCYYHKQWERTDQVEYGSKASSTTGLNTMCKIGTNQWTKQQREFKAAKAALIDLVADGELKVTDLQARIDELEADKDIIKPLEHSLEEMAYEDPRQKEEEEATDK